MIFRGDIEKLQKENARLRVRYEKANKTVAELFGLIFKNDLEIRKLEFYELKYGPIYGPLKCAPKGKK